MLKFSPANSKTRRLYQVPALQPWLSANNVFRECYSLDLPAGHTCPGAHLCKSRAVEGEDGRWTIEDGPQCRFRCFSASQEAIFPSVRKVRWHNLLLIRRAKTASKIRDLILASIPDDCGIVRYHVGGDFFSREYMRAAFAVALARPDVLFYGYTKSLHFLEGVDCDDIKSGVVLPNLLLTASVGGKHDSLIAKLGIRSAVVVYSEDAAKERGLEIDHTDEKAATPGPSFSLLLHGTQKKGSVEAQIAYQLSRQGKGTYSRKSKYVAEIPVS